MEPLGSVESPSSLRVYGIYGRSNGGFASWNSVVGYVRDPPSSSFLGLPYRILNINHKRNYLG